MTEKFQVQFLEEAVEFLDKLEEKAREKIYYNIKKAQVTNDKELFKKLNNQIWEFRTLFNKTHYRLFAFWDKVGNTKKSCYFHAWANQKDRQNAGRGPGKSREVEIVLF